jgi:hypothetical protein
LDDHINMFSVILVFDHIDQHRYAQLAYTHKISVIDIRQPVFVICPGQSVHHAFRISWDRI